MTLQRVAPRRQPLGQPLRDLGRRRDRVPGEGGETGIQRPLDTGLVAVHEPDLMRHGVLLAGQHRDGEIRAAEFAHPAADTVLGADRRRFPVGIKLNT